MLHDGEIAADLELGIDLLELLIEGGHLPSIVNYCIPESRLSIGVRQRDDLLKIAEALVGDG